MERPLFVPRSYQFRAISAIVCAGLHAPWVDGKPAPRNIQIEWPRQHGKDRAVLNALAQVAMRRKCLIWYGFPEQEHVRKSFWDNIDPLEDGGSGRRIIEDVLPWARENRTEMTLTFHATGSIIRAVGWDNYNSLVGAGPYIAAFSEYARCDPRALDYVQPMIDRNGGVIVLMTTAFGGPNNHAAVKARTWPMLGEDYFAEKLTVEDCFRDAPGEDGQRVIPEAVIEAKRREWNLSLGRSGMSEEMIRQEYYNSDEGVSEGTIFGKALMLAERNGQVIDTLTVNRSAPVVTFWDLGRSDATAVWFAQYVHGMWHVLDYQEASGTDVDWWAATLGDLARERGWVYGGHMWPHDGRQKHWGPSDTREQAGRRMLSPPPRIAEKATPLSDQINAGRALFSRARIDMTRCARGLECLRSWKYPWDNRNKVFRSTPEHDWSSHGSSAWCTFALYAQQFEGLKTQPVRKHRLASE
ncbi:MAG: hypothetical protein OEV94_12090 [Deltaproteobacteria bacterium]|nr:hypothetical protein [Deltaproteobacteria bacterium]